MCLKMTASFYQTQELLLMIHDKLMAIADNTEALADEEALTENSEAPVESISYLHGADGSFDCDLED